MLIKKLHLYISYREPEKLGETYNDWIKVYTKLRGGTNGCIVTVDYSFIELEYQNEIQSFLKSIIEMSRTIRASNDLLIAISRPNYKSLDVMKSVSDIHLRIFEYDGACMLSAIKPQLFLYNIQTDYNQGFPNAALQGSTWGGNFFLNLDFNVRIISMILIWSITTSLTTSRTRVPSRGYYCQVSLIAEDTVSESNPIPDGYTVGLPIDYCSGITNAEECGTYLNRLNNPDYQNIMIFVTTMYKDYIIIAVKNFLL